MDLMNVLGLGLKNFAFKMSSEWFSICNSVILLIFSSPFSGIPKKLYTDVMVEIEGTLSPNPAKSALSTLLLEAKVLWIGAIIFYMP